MSALAALFLGLAGATSAQAGFVPALGSPFPYAAPTQALTVLDGDRNGTVDVVAGGLTLRRGNGTGFLGNPIGLGVTGPVEGLAAGDLNGDGLTDYVAIAPGAAPGDPRRLLRFHATSGNGFVQDTVLAPADVGEATDVALGHVNGDGQLDVVFVRDGADPNVAVVFAGTASVVEFESGIGSPRDVELGDLTGDGLPDAVVAGNEAQVAVLRNTAGGFADGDLEPTGAAGASRRIALADLNGDGRTDALATDNAAAALLPLANDGAGGLVPLGPRATGLPGPARSVAAGDLDGDGRADAVAGGGSGAFAALRGDGGGGFAPVAGSPFATGAAAGDAVEAVAVADMNRDLQADVVTANRNGSVSVQLNDATGLLGASPAAIDFGALLPASETRTATITLRANRGLLRLTRLERQGSGLFAVRDVDCVGRTLLLGQSCTVSVSFRAPRRARRYEALLSVDANAAAVVIPLSATPRPPIVARPRLKRKRVRAGQRLDLRYRLSEDARTRVMTQRALAGRRAGTRCVAPTRATLKRRRCTRWVTVTTVTRRDLAGKLRMKIATRSKATGTGRKRKRGAAYPAGAYRLSVSAVDRFRNRSDEQRLRFRLLAPPQRGGARR